MPGNRASATKGQAHQIWRARKITAVAPPMSRPSLVKTRTSSRGARGSRSSRFIIQSVWSGRKRNPRRRNIRSNRLAEAVQVRQSPSYKIQPRDEQVVRGAKVSQSAVSCARQNSSVLRHCSSLVSVISVISEFTSENFCYRVAIPSKRKALSPVFASLSKAEVGSFSNWT